MNFETDQFRLKVGLAEMLKGGVIMDVVNAEQAVIAERAGACSVMALERVPSDIRRDGGVARVMVRDGYWVTGALIGPSEVSESIRGIGFGEERYDVAES